MNFTTRKILLFLFASSIVLFSCQSKQNSSAPNKINSSNDKQSTTYLEEEIITAVEHLLFAAGNYNIEELDNMVSDKAMLGISSFKEGVWNNTEITIDEYFENVKTRDLKPYCEIVNDYDIIITKERMALVRGDAILHRFGIPQTREINHFTLMKENENWEFLNISFTVEQIEEAKRNYDLDIFARSYAQAWGSLRPEFVAMYFAEDGSLQINDGEPAIGRKAIADVAQSFMTQFPDMRVYLDSLVNKPNGTAFHWTFTGTDADPKGKGHKVKVSGLELWTLNEEGFVQNSLGNFPSEEYNKQLEFGIGK